MRRQARELALQTLFQLEFSPEVPAKELLELIGTQVSSESLNYAQELVQGVHQNLAAIDSMLKGTHSHWSLQRMGTVDRSLLRLATFEMNFASAPLKPSIVINEAVELAKIFGTAESAAFVNGILDQIARENPGTSQGRSN
ncbi:MAG: transcription antitermination factor NusB [Bdellovibrio sp.]|nr:MAG: transcription antitermination factor NusB [Bdellovibrio sp.]